MTNLRLTPTEAGPVIHRPTTRLLPPRRCNRGHIAPRYVPGRLCVACAKLNLLAFRGRPGRPKAWRLADYNAARAMHEEYGGWLLRLPDGRFAVFDDPETARLYRSDRWLARCEQAQCWDEVELEQR